MDECIIMNLLCVISMHYKADSLTETYKKRSNLLILEKYFFFFLVSV
jgi:hypothetical protein